MCLRSRRGRSVVPPMYLHDDKRRDIVGQPRITADVRTNRLDYTCEPSFFLELTDGRDFRTLILIDKAYLTRDFRETKAVRLGDAPAGNSITYSPIGGRYCTTSGIFGGSVLEKMVAITNTPAEIVGDMR